MTQQTNPVIRVSDVYAGYGGADILQGVNLELHGGEIVVIVGPNGAGKSTLMKTTFGLARVSKGQVFLETEDITNIRSDQLVHKGLSYVPQERNVFPTLTVQENLEIGAYIRRDDYSPQLERIYTLFPRLKERRRQPAGLMSGGERQMVAMGRALMVEPKVLMLDEPTAGLSPAFIHQVFEWIKQINQEGISILMVEQNAKQALAIADRGYVLAVGQNRYEDTGAALLANEEVAEMFLGGR